MYAGNKVNCDLVAEILRKMPEEKKGVLRSALVRNCILTSAYILEHGTLTVYKEGFYLKLSGTRCGFSVWAYDRDGKFGFGRKPAERKLHKLYEDWLHFSESDFDDM